MRSRRLNADIITGVSLFLLFVSFGVSQGFTTVVCSAHITFCTPATGGAQCHATPEKDEPERLMRRRSIWGRRLFQALRKVILPEIRPGHDQRLYTGFYAFDRMDFAVTIFTIGNEGLETLSTFIYADARKGGPTPEFASAVNYHFRDGACPFDCD